MQTYLICVFIGVLSGLTAALCGVGGGIIMVPAFAMLLGMEQKQAVATSLAAVILTSVVATFKNSGNQLVDWKITIPTALAAALVAWFASDLLKQLSNQTLTRIFAVLMILIGTQMLFKK